MFLKNDKQYGDYQTPFDYSMKIVEFIASELHYIPNVVIEPTCGTGSFINAVNTLFQDIEIIGNEINANYVFEANKIEPNNNKIDIRNEDYFLLNERIEVGTEEKLLIIGNPPWVTNSSISVENGSNIPKKTNFKKFKGYDALTGASNFDISEYIILDLINNYYLKKPLITMICKTNVAINIFKYIYKNNIRIEFFKIEKIDATKVFDVSVDACIMYLKLNNTGESDIIEWIDDKNKDRKSGFIGQSFYMDLTDEINQLEGTTEIEWRQGIKHDASKIMELEKTGDCQYINGLKESLKLESDRIFPLVKSSHFKEYIIDDFKKYVIVTQNALKDDTRYIENNSPKLWDYLNDKVEHFQKRKSSIYKNNPEFSMFGIGDYTWKPYKVGVSGFYKHPVFSLLINEKPVMVDDTCYFLGFDNYDIAYTVMLVLNSCEIQTFLKSIANLESKRPYTKKILSRISLEKAFNLLSYLKLKDLERSLNLKSYLTEDMFDKSQEEFTNLQIKFEI